MRKNTLLAQRRKIERDLVRVNRQIAAEQQRIARVEARLANMAQERRKAA
jgi:hypothetical protein